MEDISGTPTETTFRSSYQAWRTGTVFCSTDDDGAEVGKDGWSCKNEKEKILPSGVRRETYFSISTEKFLQSYNGEQGNNQNAYIAVNVHAECKNGKSITSFLDVIIIFIKASKYIK